MDNTRFKKLYDCLLESEDLYTMVKGMTGDWVKDKNKFIKSQTELEDIVKFKDVNFD